MYGVEMSAQRLTSRALHVRTPLPGLFLRGAGCREPRRTGAFMGGLLAAAAIEPALWASLNR
jgi:all-trans-retinol 13,14-reductase